MPNNEKNGFVLIKALLLPVVFVLLIVGIAVFISSDKNFSSIIQRYGLLGFLIGSIIANSTIILPIPVDILSFMLADKPFLSQAAGILNPIALGAVVGLGAAIGEMSAYIFGRLASSGLRKIREEDFIKLDEIKDSIKNVGPLFILLGAFIPFPFDLIGIAAGLLKYNPKIFFVCALIGKSARSILIALSGYYSISFFRAFFGM